MEQENSLFLDAVFRVLREKTEQHDEFLARLLGTLLDHANNGDAAALEVCDELAGLVGVDYFSHAGENHER
jgi:hypothetical protein